MDVGMCLTVFVCVFVYAHAHECLGVGLSVPEDVQVNQKEGRY